MNKYYYNLEISKKRMLFINDTAFEYNNCILYNNCTGLWHNWESILVKLFIKMYWLLEYLKIKTSTY